MALSVTRREGESIYIGDDIVVTVQWVERGKVNLNVSAPRDVRVDRGEVRADIEANGRRS